jgi:hypothetical protein
MNLLLLIPALINLIKAAIDVHKEFSGDEKDAKNAELKGVVGGFKAHRDPAQLNTDLQCFREGIKVKCVPAGDEPPTPSQ